MLHILDNQSKGTVIGSVSFGVLIEIHCLNQPEFFALIVILFCQEEKRPAKAQYKLIVKDICFIADLRDYIHQSACRIFQRKIGI